MKFILCFWLLGMGFLLGGLPSLSVVKDGRRQNVEVHGVDVEVHVEGGFAETRVTMDFFNATNLRQEGEFVLPLPEGASVSDYALEVNGRMREATVVEKERAVRAYEEIKAKNIDPGIVFREAGNVYRTRIFPVDPKKVKRVMVGYVEEMKMKEGKYVYSLPIELREGYVSVRIFGENLEVVNPKGLKLAGVKGGFFGEVKDVFVSGELIVRSGGENFVKLVKVGDEQFVHFSGEVPEKVLKSKLKGPESVRLLWDGSSSGYARDLGREFAVLDAFFKEVGDVKVSVGVVDLVVRNAENFEVKGGDWSDVRNVLEGVEYDGVADWAKVDWKSFEEDRVVVVSSGRVILPVRKVKCSSVVHMLNSVRGAEVDAFLRELCIDSGGRVMDIFESDAEALAEELIALRARVLKVKGCQSAFDWWSDGRLRIIGKLSNAEELKIVYAVGQEVILEEDLNVGSTVVVGGDVLRRVWAQRELMRLEGEKSERQIIDFCKDYHLVGDLTAMIVLERFSDHVRYEIPPPEKNLIEKYEKALRSKRLSVRRANPFIAGPSGNHNYGWWARTNWYKKDYPWMEVLLYPRYEVVRKWVVAQASVFTKEQLAVMNRDIFVKWMGGVKELSKERRELNSMDDFLIWKKRFDGLKQSGEGLSKLSISYPIGDFGVSVRGLVANPQTMNLKKGEGLRGAIEMAGGAFGEGDLSRVALYRNGNRMIYNLESKKYQKVLLKPGDMVVVEFGYSDGGWDVDPFAASSDSLRASGAKPAIVESGYNFRMNSVLLDPFGGDVASGDGVPMKGKIRAVREVVDIGMEGLLVQENLWESYLEVRGRRLGREVFVRVSEKLFEKGEKERARRVLSNLFIGVDGLDESGVREVMYRSYLIGDMVFSRDLENLLENLDRHDHRILYENWLMSKVKGQAGFEAWCIARLDGWGIVPSLSSNFVEMEVNQLGMKLFKGERLMELSSLGKGCFPSDVRVLVLATGEAGSSFMNVTDPAGVEVKGNEEGLTGGWSRCDEGMAEFMVRKAIPGKYRIGLRGGGSYLVQVWTNWGKKGQEKRVYMVDGGRRGMIDGGVVEFEMME